MAPPRRRAAPASAAPRPEPPPGGAKPKQYEARHFAMWQADPAFRRFHEAYEIDVPRLIRMVMTDKEGKPVPQSESDDPVEWLSLNLAGTKTVVNPDGTINADDTTLLRYSLEAHLRCKEAWRRSGFSPLTLKLLSAVGAAPSVPPARAAADEAPPSPRSVANRKFAMGNQIVAVLLLLIAVAVVVHWPMWDLVVDPDASGHYKVLGVQPGADYKEIKKAFRKQARRWHPDHNPDCGKRCQQMMVRLQEAHTALTKEADLFSLELSQKEKENNGKILTLVGLFLGRVFETVHQSSEFLTILTLSDGRPRIRWIIRAICHLGVMGLYFIEDGQIGLLVVLFTGGLRFNQLLEAPKAVFLPDANHIRFEAPKYFKWFVLPAFVLHLATVIRDVDLMESRLFTGLQCLCGVLYTAAFVMRHRPYFFLSSSFQAAPANWHHKWGFWRPSIWSVGDVWSISKYLLWEVGLDDLLAFAIDVPWMFRASCLILLLLTLLQRTLYPFILLRLERRVGAVTQEALVEWGTMDGWKSVHMEMSGMTKEQDDKALDAMREDEKAARLASMRQERLERELENREMEAAGMTPLTDKERAERERQERKDERERLRLERDEYVDSSGSRRTWTVGGVLGSMSLFVVALYFADQYMGGGKRAAV
eukprot:TRINITY_DN6067_c0_g1_i1.p1 TRINITY_DN6067_c0_g1~~TRINITY_DN6067_c0_g1_i1.p1  ORF type:complete len:649 (+),score=203.52 TRINITY_DN6067_c0_g1_i1:73-2019(+)